MQVVLEIYELLNYTLKRRFNRITEVKLYFVKQSVEAYNIRLLLQE